MKNEKLLRAIGNVEDEMILDAIKEPRKKKYTWSKWVALAASIAVVVMGTGMAVGYLGRDNNDKPVVVATLALDVNPSMEIGIGKDERVVTATPLNEEARKVLKDMELKNVDIDVAINAIIGSMLKNGYLSIDSNSILVSVASGDTQIASRLQNEISTKINGVLAASSIDASIMTQTYEKDKDTNKQAEEYKVSPAKATLISKIIDSGLKDAHGKAYTYENLIELNVNELKMILESKSVKIDGVTSSGTASNGNYMAKEEVLAIVYKHAGVDAANVIRVEYEMDFDGNAIMYEIDFETKTKEYEYEVDAKTGAIIEHEVENRDDINNNQTNNNKNEKPTTADKNIISESEAKSIAYKDAGIPESSILKVECELDIENGKTVYEIEIDTATKEYSYEIDAVTGKILDKEVELEDSDDDDD